MPAPTQILTNLDTIANDAMWLAIAWHAVLLGALTAFMLGWRPARRTAALALLAPLASVAIVAAAYGNVFNALAFGVATVALLVMALRMPASPLIRAADWQILVGHFLIGFGILYPHFLHHASPLAYIIAAPFGTLPCPTLAAVIGFTLVAGGLSKSWNLTLVFLAVFYGTVGVMQLDVWIDIAVVLAGLALSYTAAQLMYRAPWFATR